MRLCIPIQYDEGYSSQMDERYESAPFWAIYESEPKKLYVHTNPLLKLTRITYDLFIVALLCDGVDIILDRGLTGHAKRKVCQHGIRVFKSNEQVVFHVLQDCHQKIERLTKKFQWHGTTVGHKSFLTRDYALNNRLINDY